jgi:hypothetical protein
MVCLPCKRQEHINCVTREHFSEPAWTLEQDAEVVRAAFDEAGRQAATWCDCQHEQPVRAEPQLAGAL